MKDVYVQATLSLLASGQDVETVLKGLHTTLLERGSQKLYPSILSAVVRELDGAPATTRIRVVSEAAHKAQKAVIEEALAACGYAEGEVEVTIDNTLIGGYVVEHNFTRKDASYKRALEKLYTRIVSH